MYAAHSCFALVLLLTVVETSVGSAEIDNAIGNANQTTGRSGRKDFSPPVYSAPDTYPSKKPSSYYPSDDSAAEEHEATGFEPSIHPRVTKDDSTSAQTGPLYSPSSYEEYLPLNQYHSGARPRWYAPESNGPMYHSPSSEKWNIWKDDLMDSSATSNIPDNSKGGQSDFTGYYFPPSPPPPTNNWKGDPFTFPPDQMSHMMMMNMQNKGKFGGILSKITQNPAILLIVAILPISLILSAVLPTLVNMMMNGGLPTITTTATGNTNGRNFDTTEFLSPVMQTITTFGVRSFEHPDCMQKIFCQVTKGSSVNGTEPRSFQRALYSASRLIDSQWLENFGVKTLFDSMADGNCEKIPCSTQSSSSRSGDKRKKS